MSRIVSCYVERRGAHWDGVVIDFDLAVHGTSFEEVRDKLHGAIREYLRYVDSLPEAERDRFLNRRVPFWTRFAFGVNVLLASIFRRPPD